MELQCAESRCRISDLRYKEVINLLTGARLGFARDVEISLETGQLLSIVIPGALRFFGLLGREEDIVVPWDAIDRIGDDILLVKYTEEKAKPRRRSDRGR